MAAYQRGQEQSVGQRAEQSFISSLSLDRQSRESSLEFESTMGETLDSSLQLTSIGIKMTCILQYL